MSVAVNVFALQLAWEYLVIFPETSYGVFFLILDLLFFKLLFHLIINNLIISLSFFTPTLIHLLNTPYPRHRLE